MRAVVPLVILSCVGCTSPTNRVDLSRHPAQASSELPKPDPEMGPLLKLYDAQNDYANPNAPDTNGGYYGWANCFSEAYGHAPVKLVGSQLAEECKPDTLYSWQSDASVRAFAKAASGPKWAGALGKSALFTHVNPVATYGYGPQSIRLKIKKGISFKAVPQDAQYANYCTEFLKPGEAERTIVLRAFNGGTDYILCSTGPIESWSMNTPKHFDEIASSTRWYFAEAPKRNWIPYRQFIPVGPGDPISALFISEDEGRDFDGHSFLQSDLIENLKRFRAAISKNQQVIQYAPGIPVDPARHFATERPIYWNHSKSNTGVAAPVTGASSAKSNPALSVYSNEDYGYQFSYPADLLELRDRRDSAALTFGARGGGLTIDIFAVEETKSLDAVFKEYLANTSGNVAYKTVNAAKGFFVISAVDGQFITYTKAIYKAGVLIQFTATYEVASKAELDKIVGDMANSLTLR